MTAKELKDLLVEVPDEAHVDIAIWKKLTGVVRFSSGAITSLRQDEEFQYVLVSDYHRL